MVTPTYDYTPYYNFIDGRGTLRHIQNTQILVRNPQRRTDQLHQGTPFSIEVPREARGEVPQGHRY
jgi:hypothetical protein